MPPVAANPVNLPNGQTARDAYMRPLQTRREFPVIAKFCVYRQIPRRGGVTPPYRVIYKMYPRGGYTKSKLLTLHS